MKNFCPFCGSELKHLKVKPKVWQALVVGNKAPDALNRIEQILLLDSEKPMTLTPAGKKEIKEIIASITKGVK